MRIAAAAITLAVLASCTEIEAPTPDRRGPSLVARFPIGSAPSFGVLAVGDARVREIVLENAGDAPLQVELPAVEAPFSLDAEGTVEIGPATTITRTIRYQPLEAGEHALTLTFGSNGGQATLAFVGEAVEMPFVCTPDEVDFGTAVRGQGTSRVITCASRIDAEQALLLDPIQSDPGSFTYASEKRRLQLPAYGATEFPVLFSAGDPGLARGRLAVLREGTRQLEIVDLRGTSIASPLAVEPAAWCDTGGNYLGAAGIGIPVLKTFALQNLGTEPLALDGLAFAEGPFSVTPSGPQSIPPGGSLEIEVTATPASLGTAWAALRIETDDPRAPAELLCFRVLGAGPAVKCDPMVDFGWAYREGQAFASLACEVDAPADSNYRLRRVETDDPAFEAWLREAPPVEGYAPGAKFYVDLAWTAGDGLEQWGELRLLADDHRSPEFEVPMRGTVVWPSCTVSIPSPLEFGFVAASTSAVRSALVVNQGSKDCWIESVRAIGSDKFSFDRAPELPAILPPDGILEIPIRFSPEGPFFSGAELTFQTSDQNRPAMVLPLEGFGGDGCVSVSTQRLEFGKTWPGCPAPLHELVLTNRCEVPRTATLQQRCTSASSCGTVLGATSVTVPAAGTEHVSLRFAPATEGEAFGVVEVATGNWDDSAQVQYVREFHGESATGEQRDVFPQEIEGTRTFPLSSLALDVNGDGWVDEFDGAEVRIDDVRLGHVDALGRTWSVRTDVQELVFREDRAPAAGSVASIEYVLACTQP